MTRRLLIQQMATCPTSKDNSVNVQQPTIAKVNDNLRGGEAEPSTGIIQSHLAKKKLAGGKLAISTVRKYNQGKNHRARAVIYFSFIKN